MLTYATRYFSPRTRARNGFLPRRFDLDLRVRMRR